LSRGVDGVEQEPEGGVRLAPMLNRKAKKDDVPAADGEADDRAAALNHVLALDPTADEKVFRSITRNRLRRWRRRIAAVACAAGDRRRLVRRTEREERSRLCWDAVRERARYVDIQTQNRAGAEHTIVGIAGHVPEGQLEGRYGE